MLVCAVLVCWQAFFQTELVPVRVSRIVFGVEQDENSTVSQICQSKCAFSIRGAVKLQIVYFNFYYQSLFYLLCSLSESCF